MPGRFPPPTAIRKTSGSVSPRARVISVNTNLAKEADHPKSLFENRGNCSTHFEYFVHLQGRKEAERDRHCSLSCSLSAQTGHERFRAATAYRARETSIRRGTARSGRGIARTRPPVRRPGRPLSPGQARIITVPRCSFIPEKGLDRLQVFGRLLPRHGSVSVATYLFDHSRFRHFSRHATTFHE